MSTPNRMPAEWEPHQAMWLAWPSDPIEWPGTLQRARVEFTELCRALTTPSELPNAAEPEDIKVLVMPGESQMSARDAMAGIPVKFVDLPYGDIWLRDTGPIFVEQHGSLVAQCFQWNGWGGKYLFPLDLTVNQNIAQTAGSEIARNSFVLEGGGIEVDGVGTLMTTRQCLLNPNRNPTLTKEDLERLLTSALGVEHFIWLGDGLLNDHTDGHIDTIARFVAPGKVVCMAPSGPNDPNHDILNQIQRDLRDAKTLDGKPLEVITVPSPGTITNDQGDLLAASYVNFIIANHAVIVPIYGVPQDDAVLRTLQAHFPGRSVRGVLANAIASAGGAFHCITQQEPALAKPKT